MSSPPPGMIPNLEQTSPNLDASLEDFQDLWPLLDDQETLVAQPESSNFGFNQTRGNTSLSQTDTLDNTPLPMMNCDPIGTQLVKRQDTSLLPKPSAIGCQGLLLTNAPAGVVLMCSEENAGCPASRLDAGKGKGKALQTVISPESREVRGRSSRRVRNGRRAPDQPHTDGEDGLAAKKQDHNAKERLRRMKLNATYLALGALLPQSRRSKKRWSAPLIIDRVVEYIPELKLEIEELTIEKEKMLDQKTEVVDNRISSSTTSEAAAASSDQLERYPITVSVHEVGSGGELIIQICTKKKDREDHREGNGIVSLLSNFDAEGLSVSSASTLDVGEDWVCYHLQIQMDGSSRGPDYAAVLRGKVISWLTGSSSS